MRRLRFRPGTKYRQGFAARSRCFHRFRSEATGGDFTLQKGANVALKCLFAPFRRRPLDCGHKRDGTRCNDQFVVRLFDRSVCRFCRNDFADGIDGGDLAPRNDVGARQPRYFCGVLTISSSREAIMPPT